MENKKKKEKMVIFFILEDDPTIGEILKLIYFDSAPRLPS